LRYHAAAGARAPDRDPGLRSSVPAEAQLSTKDLLPRFRTATWVSDAEVDQFAAAEVGVAPADLLRLLEALRGRSADDPQTRRRRCLAFGRLAERFADRSLFGAFARALPWADAPLRSVLTQMLQRINNVSEHGELVAHLRTADPQLRATAAQVLGEIGGRGAFEALEGLARDPAFPGRMEAMSLLVSLGKHHAVPGLRAVLAVGSPAEKAQAIRHLVDPRTLGRDTARVLAALAAAFEDANEAVAAQALGAFTGLSTEDEYFQHAAPFLDHPSLTLSRGALEGLRRFGSTRAVEAVRRALRRGPNAVRLVALGVLEGIGNEAVLSPLVEALSQPHLVVRTRASEVLQRLSRAGRVDLVRTVVWLLRTRDVEVRRLAVEIAQSVPDPDGQLWPKLLEYLRDEDWWVRERVADALVDMAGPALVRHVVVLLQDPSDTMRRFAVDVLVRLRAPESLGALVRTAGADADWWVRERAIEAIARIGDARAVPHVVDLMVRNPELRLACLDALGILEARSAAPHVAALLVAEEADVAHAALRCLERIGDVTQAPSVEPLLADVRASLRLPAREVLRRWNATAAQAAPSIEGLSTLDRLLIEVARAEADDLILSPGRPPHVKRLGRTAPLAAEALSASQLRELLMPCLSVAQREALQSRRDVDLSYEVKAEALRFRANVFNQMGGLSAVFRLIKGTFLELDALGVPPVVHGFAELKNGLVLVGGPTGSGKSTTLAAIIDRINRTSGRHVISLEDPIEVVHARKMSLVNQREVGTHARSFSAALRATLRQDPDVILVGEMRDADTVTFALSAAETGHLVFGSIHTASAATSIDRIINACPTARHDDVRSMLAGSLRAVVSQHLLRRADGTGRVLAVEVMLNSDAVANLIRKGKTFQIPSVIATSKEAGMQLMDTELVRLHRQGLISAEDAYVKAVGKKDFEALIGPEGSGPPVARTA
jgi:twitching motility protein PilT